MIYKKEGGGNMKDFLEHYGVKGMKWGVRRFQNADGSLTSAGKKRYSEGKILRNVKSTSEDVEGIIKTLTSKERKLLGGKPGTRYLPEEEYSDVAKRFVKKVGDTPVAFLDIYKASGGAGSMALATRSGKDYRGKGYAGDLVKKAQNWLDTKEAKEALNVNTLNWFAKRENQPSLKLAKKYGFSEREDYKDDAEWWGGRYHKDASKEISKATYDEIQRIHASLSAKEKYYLGDMNVSKYTTYAKTKNGAYITLDNYRGDYRDEHPYSGQIISIAANKKSRGTGATDSLIKGAIKDNPSSRLIAEIDTENTASQRLFKRNGFKKIGSRDGILFFAYDTRKK